MTMHSDEIEIDAPLVERLIREQFPQWTDLSITAVPASGTVNAIFRLGDELQVRLPRSPQWPPDLDKDFRWLPRLAPLLPLRIPTPVGRGVPGSGYPFEWTIYDWINGAMATPETVDLAATATDLAGFARSLHTLDIADGPPNTHRGIPLATADAGTRSAIEELRGEMDTDLLLEVWDSAVAAPGWDRPPVWIHGDLWNSNLLVHDRRIRAVIDFELLGTGDPAVDSLPAWTLLDAETRPIFRRELGVDAATWERGRGWALSFAVLALPYYRDTNPVIVASAQHVVAQILQEISSI